MSTGWERQNKQTQRAPHGLLRRCQKNRAGGGAGEVNDHLAQGPLNPQRRLSSHEEPPPCCLHLLLGGAGVKYCMYEMFFLNS